MEVFMKIKFNITGLDCPNGAAKLAALMEREAGVSSAKINFLTEKLTVESECNADALLPRLCEIAKAFDKSVKVTK